MLDGWDELEWMRRDVAAVVVVVVVVDDCDSKAELLRRTRNSRY